MCILLDARQRRGNRYCTKLVKLQALHDHFTQQPVRGACTVMYRTHRHRRAFYGIILKSTTHTLYLFPRQCGSSSRTHAPMHTYTLCCSASYVGCLQQYNTQEIKYIRIPGNYESTAAVMCRLPGIYLYLGRNILTWTTYHVIQQSTASMLCCKALSLLYGGSNGEQRTAVPTLLPPWSTKKVLRVTTCKPRIVLTVVSAVCKFGHQ